MYLNFVCVVLVAKRRLQSHAQETHYWQSMSSEAELILALCFVWGWSYEVLPSDLCLLLLWLVLGLEMKGMVLEKQMRSYIPPGLLHKSRCPTLWTALLWEFPWMAALQRYTALEGGKGRGWTQLQSFYLFKASWCLHLSWVLERLSSPANAKSHDVLCFPILQKAGTILFSTVVREVASGAMMTKTQCDLKRVAFSFLGK